MTAAARLALAAALVVVTAGATATQAPVRVVAHEWGTFTTVAGTDGHSLQWLPLGGPQDLPCFVERFKGQQFKVLLASQLPLNYEQARTQLRGTVRMETPVIYFYADNETTVNVQVRFPQGLVSEWYPKALVVQPSAYEDVLRKQIESVASWSGVRIRPGATPTLPQESRPSHYYAARATDAAPVQVSGQDEKFLFYRGVGGFEVPIAAIAEPDGRVRVTNTGQDAMAGVVLFENRGGKIGYRLLDRLQGSEILEAPSLTADMSALGRDLERLLVAQGLYAKEAAAMVETWRDSWFEEGTRIFYIVPSAAVDTILPLAISPKPAEVARAFVGRVELLTERTLRDVRDAIAEADDHVIATYGRFLEPIANRLLSGMTSADRARANETMQAAYNRYISGLTQYCR